MKKMKLLLMLALSLWMGAVNAWAEDEDVWKPKEPFFFKSSGVSNFISSAVGITMP